jgi:hypothetical protein
MFPLNEHTRWILGRPNFTLMRTGHALRKLGVDIATKAEDEQAVSIYWLLCMYERHPEDWREMATRLMRGELPCNRTACQKPGAVWWNTSTRAYYCTDCAKAINEHNPGLCVLI